MPTPNLGMRAPTHPPAGTHPDTGRPCVMGLMLMPFYGGGSLRDLLDGVGEGTRPAPSPQQVRAFVRDMVAAADSLQHLGCVHG